MNTLELQNPWWKDGSIGETLAPRYHRYAFNRAKKLFAMRQIVVITGLRRVGKSTIMYQLIEDLLKSNTDPKHILYFTFDDAVEGLVEVLNEFEHLTRTDWKKERCLIFFDEIQKLPDWSNKLKIIYDAAQNLKIVVSGSGSFLLETETKSNLAGRHFILSVPPLSFTEYLEMKTSKIELGNEDLWSREIEKEFESYLFRPFPELVQFDELSLIKSYIRDNVIEKITRSDIIAKFHDVNVQLLSTLVTDFYTEPGAYLNLDNLSRDLKISKNTLIPHLHYLEYSYLFRPVSNYRPSTRSTSRKMRRIYPYHWSLGFGWNGVINRESVAASLLDAKFYWRDKEKEIDFLLVDDAAVIPVEVKEAKKLKGDQIKTMTYFMKRFKADSGILLYEGREQQIEVEDRRITTIPFWKYALSYRHGGESAINRKKT